MISRPARAQLFRAAGVSFQVKDDLPENDALWALLAKSRRATPSPFFVRNVLREIRPSTPPSAFHLFLRWLTPAAYAALTLGFFLSLPLSKQPVATHAIDPLELFDEFAPPAEFTPAHLAGL